MRHLRACARAADALARRRPELSRLLHLSFALSDPGQLAELFSAAGFADLRISQETAEAAPQSFDDYWKPIEAGVGSIPQAYLTLPVADRRPVRDEVRSHLARFESEGKLHLSVEMLIASGQA